MLILYSKVVHPSDRVLGLELAKHGFSHDKAYIRTLHLLPNKNCLKTDDKQIYGRLHGTYPDPLYEVRFS